MNKFQYVRIFKNDLDTGSCFQTKNRIEFVVNSNKLQQFLTRIFGNLYNIGFSRYHDGLMVYRPQDYRDFLTFLHELKVEDQDFIVYKMIEGPQQILSNDKVTFYEHKKVENGAESLINYAAECLKDYSFTEEEIIDKKVKFIAKCFEILETMGIILSKTKEIKWI